MMMNNFPHIFAGNFRAWSRAFRGTSRQSSAFFNSNIDNIPRSNRNMTTPTGPPTGESWRAALLRSIRLCDNNIRNVDNNSLSQGTTSNKY